MTLQSGRGVLCTQGWRTLSWCTLFEVIRRDGVALHFTDSSNTIEWIDGNTYTPLYGGELTDEQREALKESEMEVIGLLHHDAITEDDIRAGLYRNAVLKVHVIDWRRPYKIHYKSWKRIEDIAADSGVFRASVMGLTRELQRKVGRRSFRLCDLVLGGRRCGADLTHRQVADVWVESVSTNRREFVVESATLGELSVSAGVSVTVDATAKTFTIGSGTWRNIPPIGSTINVSGYINGGNNGAHTVTAATDTVITVDSGGLVNETATATIDTPWYDDYFREGEVEFQAGLNKPALELLVIGWEQATRTVTLLLPAPFDISGQEDVVSASSGNDDQVSVDSATKTFSLPAGVPWDRKPAAGQRLVTSGFSQAGNNGTFTIDSVQHDTVDGVFTITVEESTVDESAGATVTMQVSDKVTLRAGCDGTFAACKTKLQNEVRFGGDKFVSGPREVIKGPP